MRRTYQIVIGLALIACSLRPSINGASVDEISQIRGIGATKAKAIVENMPYESTQDFYVKTEKILGDLTQERVASAYKLSGKRYIAWNYQKR